MVEFAEGVRQFASVDVIHASWGDAEGGLEEPRIFFNDAGNDDKGDGMVSSWTARTSG